MADDRTSDNRESGDGHAPHPGTHEGSALSHLAKRSLALQELLVEKGIIGEGDVQRGVEEMDARSPADGARVVARAWVDPGFKQRLLTEARPAIAELGYGFATDMELEVVENTERVHHLVVCTLCSCYPRSLLGSPPDWYKSVAYRSRAVVEPRKVTQEFGLTLDDSVEVRVVDSTADLRYLVMPRRPAGTDDLSEEELAKLVTRDSMIGVTDPLSPESVTTLSGLSGD